MGGGEGDRVPILFGARQFRYAADLATGEVEYWAAGHPPPELLVLQAQQVQELPRVLHRGGEEVAGNVPERQAPASRDHMRALLRLAWAEPDAPMRDAAFQVDDGEVRLWPDRGHVVLVVLVVLTGRGRRARVDDHARPRPAVPLSRDWALGPAFHHARARGHVPAGYQ